MDDPVGWLEEGDDLYYSNGTDFRGRITGGVYILGNGNARIAGLFIDRRRIARRAVPDQRRHSNSATGEESGISASTQFKRTT